MVRKPELAPRALIFILAVVLGAAALVGCRRGPADAGTELPTSEPPPLEPLRVYRGFDRPESVLHDPVNDVYLVSNVVGSPLGRDGKGFISRLSPEGGVLALRWIDGDAEGVTLNAPKGMTLSGSRLYVADLDVVRVFDRDSGAVLGEIPVEGATFLNGMATGRDGRVFVSDMGMQMGEGGMSPSGSDAIHHVGLEEGAEALVRDVGLGHPNGLFVVDDGVWVVTFGTGELYRVDGNGERSGRRRLPAGRLDGIVGLSDGTVFVSSWEGGRIFRGTVNGDFESFVEGVNSPADIGFDARRRRLLVPRMMEDEVSVYRLP